MSYIGNSPGVSSQRVVTEEVISGSAKSAFYPVGGYALGYVDVLINGLEVDSADFTAADGVVVTLATAAAVGDTVKIKAYIPRGLSDGYLKTEADALLAAKVAKAGDTVTGPLVMDTSFQNGLRILRNYNVTSGGPAGQSIQFGAKQGTTPVYPIELNAVTDSDGTAYGFSVFFNGGSALTINKTGNLVLPSGKGIDFSANANAGGMTGEVLNDYEEGTWTPIVITDGGGQSITHTVQRGVYTKVGRVVTVSWYVAWSAFTGGSNGVRISNLPFLSQNSGPGVYYTGGNAEHSSSITYPASLTTLTYETAQNATTILPVLNGSGAGTVGLTRTYVGTGNGYFIGSVTYDAA